MATGSGKTFTACNFCYRLIKHAGARRILFLIDRRTLGQQTKKEFEMFSTPEEHRKFTELYNVRTCSRGSNPRLFDCVRPRRAVERSFDRKVLFGLFLRRWDQMPHEHTTLQLM